MLSDIKLALRLAYRARFVALSSYFCIALAVIAAVATQFSARQLATVALDVGLSLIRLGLPVLAVMLVQELMTREIDRKFYLTSLTYPRPRHQWLLGRVLATCLMLFTLLVVMALILAGLVTYVEGTYQQATAVSLGWPYQVTLAFICVDLLVTVAMATFLSMVASTPSFVLIGTLGFLLIARSYMPIIQMLLDNRNLVEKLADPEVYRGSLNLLSYVLPDLGTLDVRMVALYGKVEFLPADWPLLLGSAMTYVVLLLALAAWRLNKRELI